MIRHLKEYEKRKRRVLIAVTIWAVLYLIALIVECKRFYSP